MSNSDKVLSCVDSPGTKISELIGELAKQAKDEEELRLKSKQVPWMMPPRTSKSPEPSPPPCPGEPSKGKRPKKFEPDPWKGSPFDWIKMYYPFDSFVPSHQIVHTLRPICPGAAGDLPMAALQVDYLSCAERAFRARHTTSFPRGVAHHALRRKGQGDSGGPLKYGVLDYLRDLKKVSDG
jgi:hypothetical protein